MSAKASTLKSSIEACIRRQGIEAEMEQNLVKEAIHLHLLSAMSEAGILRHAVFQGGAVFACATAESATAKTSPSSAASRDLTSPTWSSRN